MPPKDRKPAAVGAGTTKGWWRASPSISGDWDKQALRDADGRADRATLTPGQVEDWRDAAQRRIINGLSTDSQREDPAAVILTLSRQEAARCAPTSPLPE